MSNDIAMSVVLDKWGDGLGLRIPGELVDAFNFRPGSRIRIAASGSKITLEPAATKVPARSPNAETAAALEEYADMVTHPERYKRYSSFREAMDEVLAGA